MKLVSTKPQEGKSEKEIIPFNRQIQNDLDAFIEHGDIWYT